MENQGQVKLFVCLFVGISLMGFSGFGSCFDYSSFPCKVSPFSCFAFQLMELEAVFNFPCYWFFNFFFFIGFSFLVVLVCLLR